ncbi:ABC transporter ATP-binding protein [Paenibacillus filicis]|uniref:ABC transporter ATP-binding protein n=1 Tax=Paenibacillus gyeongsangnamensis TaxID=3388067 RepID=A0ABT4QKH4_9BACL|nr:ABC transporter ATP-binding protein [Paenibacillus filicis]MCZ8517340.1 ABC transporter ATP-binding protein [Paenibacillus filicis]
MTRAILQVKDVNLAFSTSKGQLEALSNISFEILEGEILGIVGESGCGKSITSLSIMGLLPVETSHITNGSIIFEEKNLTKLNREQMRDIRGKNISMVFQEPMTSLNPVFSIGDQLTEAVRYHLKVSKKDAIEHVQTILESIGIPSSRNIMDEYPHQLSGGMRQRVMIAMALSCHPKLLIADEPTTALDVTIQAQILALLKKINREFKTSILLITHDLGVVSEMCDRVIVMYAGQIVETGKVDELLENPRHPYTKGLLQSIPKIEETRRRLDTIPGTVPQLGKMPAGCRFSPRCSFSTEKCGSEPTMINIGPDHHVKCWHAV